MFVVYIYFCLHFLLHTNTLTLLTEHLNGDGNVGRDNGEHEDGGVPEGGDHQTTAPLAPDKGLRGELSPLGVQTVKGATFKLVISFWSV